MIQVTLNEPKWRNWQTRTTQNRVVFDHVGSTPTFGTIFTPSTYCKGDTYFVFNAVSHCSFNEESRFSFVTAFA